MSTDLIISHEVANRWQTKPKIIMLQLWCHWEKVNTCTFRQWKAFRRSRFSEITNLHVIFYSNLHVWKTRMSIYVNDQIITTNYGMKTRKRYMTVGMFEFLTWFLGFSNCFDNAKCLKYILRFRSDISKELTNFKTD